MAKKQVETVVRRVLGDGTVNGKKQRRQPLTVVNGGLTVKPKRPGGKKLTRNQWRGEYGRALRADPAFQKAMERLPPRHAALLVAWATNGNNLHRAALQCGYSAATAKNIAKTEGFREAQRFVDTFVPSEDREWRELLGAARFTLRDLLKSPDDKVRYLAAKDLVDRAEGKSITRVDMSIREEHASLTDGEMQLAFSLMQQLGLGFAAALNWIRAHPEETSAWVAEHASSPGGKLTPLAPAALPTGETGTSVEAEYEIVARPLALKRHPEPLLGFRGDWCREMER